MGILNRIGIVVWVFETMSILQGLKLASNVLIHADKIIPVQCHEGLINIFLSMAK